MVVFADTVAILVARRLPILAASSAGALHMGAVTCCGDCVPVVQTPLWLLLPAHRHRTSNCPRCHFDLQAGVKLRPDPHLTGPLPHVTHPPPLPARSSVMRVQIAPLFPRPNSPPHPCRRERFRRPLRPAAAGRSCSARFVHPSPPSCAFVCPP